jgi:hypothetical protein
LASASIGTVNSITDSSDLSFESAGTNTVAAFLDNSGDLRVDRKGGAGGTILNIGGTLTNSGSLLVGNTTLSAPDEVTAASLDNTGKIYLTGSTADQALLDVAGSAGFGTAGVLSGYARLAGDSAIEFASGEITSLADKTHLGLVGSDAFIEDSTATGSNSALTGLASIGHDALFALHDGASVSTTGALANDGTVALDPGSGDGGSSLTVGGTLTNSGSLSIGNATLSASDEATAASLDNTGGISLIGSGANQALLDVTAGSAGFGTAGVLSGNVELAGDSAIEFASGQITSLAASAQLHLNGNDAFLEDSTALGSNSALTGLASIGSGATFDFENGAAVSTTGALANDGTVNIDAHPGEGGSSLTVAGALNSGNLVIGNATLAAPDEVTAVSLDNTSEIFLTGSSADQALLDVAGSAGFGTAGVLSGFVDLTGDSAIEFASGQITRLAYTFFLNGNDAFIEDSTALGSNSALKGLSEVDEIFSLSDGASVSTIGALVNYGYVYLDHNGDGGTGGDGGSSLTVGGTLTNSNGLFIGNDALSAPDEVTAASLDSTGSISLTGSTAKQALLDVTAGSAGFGDGHPERQCWTGRRQRDRVRERADQHDRRWFAIGPLRRQRLHRGQHGSRLEQRIDWALQHRGLPRTLGRGLGVDDGGSDQQRQCLSWVLRRGDPLDRGRADQYRHAGYRHQGPFLVRLRYGGILHQQRDGRSKRRRGESGRPRRVGSDDQQRLDFDYPRRRDVRRSGRRHGVLQPQWRQPSVRLERFVRADHHREGRGRAHAQ